MVMPNPCGKPASASSFLAPATSAAVGFSDGIGAADARRARSARRLAGAVEQPVDDELAVDELGQRLADALCP